MEHEREESNAEEESASLDDAYPDIHKLRSLLRKFAEVSRDDKDQVLQDARAAVNTVYGTPDMPRRRRRERREE